MSQITLTGEKTDETRFRPDTFRWCQGCTEDVLRSRWDDHDAHHQEAAEEFVDEELEEDEDDEPEEIGAWYDIRIEYNVTYAFRVPGYSEYDAGERAEDLVLDAHPVDSYQLHTDRTEIEPIMSDDPDLPDDFDPYGGEMLWEVLD